MYGNQTETQRILSKYKKGPVRGFVHLLFVFSDEAVPERKNSYPLFSILGMYMIAFFIAAQIADGDDSFIYQLQSDIIQIETTYNSNLNLDPTVGTGYNWIYALGIVVSEDNMFFLKDINYASLKTGKQHYPSFGNIQIVEDFVAIPSQLSDQAVALREWLARYLAEVEYLENNLSFAGKDDIIYRKHHIMPGNWQAYMLRFPDYYPLDYESIRTIKWGWSKRSICYLDAYTKNGPE